MKGIKIKVTTTSNFENFKITEYLEPVSSHVVIGMNIFTDILVSFTDFFGGESHSYQNILTSINAEVIEKLRKKASDVGANCVVGLKIDNDEIGAQGKSMIMVTATGTAAVANFPVDSVKIIEHKKLSSVSSDLLDVLFEKNEYILNSEVNTLSFDDDFWSFVKKQKVNELAGYIIEQFEEAVFEFQEYQLDSLKTHLVEYLCLIDDEIASEVIYSKLSTELSPVTRSHLSDVLIRSNLVDYKRILNLMKSENSSILKNAIFLCSNHKSNYVIDDIKQVGEIVDYIEDKFRERGSEKEILSSKEMSIWICECGKENYSFDLYCSKCKNDVFGFEEGEITPDQLIEILNLKIEILTRVMV